MHISHCIINAIDFRNKFLLIVVFLRSFMIFVL